MARPATWEIVGVRPASGGWLAVGGITGIATMLFNLGWVWLYSTIVGQPSIPVARIAAAHAVNNSVALASVLVLQ